MVQIRLAALLGGFLFVAGLSSTAWADTQVTIDNFTFSPAEITVSPGTRVVWTNQDDIPHTVTGADEPREIRSQPLDSGESFGFTFMRPGIYRYFCSLHPHMQGKVVVR